jgi:hypothetical protein
MSGTWQLAAQAVRGSDPAAVDRVHRFLSQVLAVDARAVGQKLADLETALRRGFHPEAERLVAEIGPSIESLQRATEDVLRRSEPGSGSLGRGS